MLTGTSSSLDATNVNHPHDSRPVNFVPVTLIGLGRLDLDRDPCSLMHGDLPGIGGKLASRKLASVGPNAHVC